MIEKLNFGNSTIVDAVCAHKINELVDTVNELQAKDEEIAEWIAIVGDLRKQVRELQETFESIHPYLKYKDLTKAPAENVLTKSLRMDKEFVEEEMERLQKENSNLKDKLERITDILYESKYALEEIINPSFISHEQEMAQEALDKVNAEIKAITGENNND